MQDLIGVSDFFSDVSDEKQDSVAGSRHGNKVPATSTALKTVLMLGPFEFKTSPWVGES